MDNKEILGEFLEAFRVKRKIIRRMWIEVYNLLGPHIGSKDMTP